MNKHQILTWSLFLLVVVSGLAISHGDTTLAPYGVSLFVQYLKWPFVLMALLVIDWKQGLSILSFGKMVLAISFLIFTKFHVATGYESKALIVFLTLFVFAFYNDGVLLDVFKLYRKYIILLAIISIICFVDYFTIGILPHSLVPYYSKQVDTYYINYFVSYIILFPDLTFRCCGTFNEPGIFGSTMALILISDGLNFKKLGNVILLIAVVLTFSMAAFSLLIIAAILYGIKNMKTFLLVLCSFGFLLVVSPYIENKGYQHLIERFEYDSSTGKFKGDNRKGYEFRAVEKKFEETGNKFWGMGTGYCSMQNMSDYSTYKTTIIEWGYGGYVCTVGLLVLLSFYACRNDKDAIIFWLCECSTIYSSNTVLTLYQFVMAFGGILYVISKNQDNEKEEGFNICTLRRRGSGESEHYLF